MPDGRLKQHFGVEQFTTHDLASVESCNRLCQTCTGSNKQQHQTRGPIIERTRSTAEKANARAQEKADTSEHSVPGLPQTWAYATIRKGESDGKEGKNEHTLTGSPQNPNPGGMGVTCWNCIATGHVAKDSPNPEVHWS